jgi:stage V sporulation protein S
MEGKTMTLTERTQESGHDGGTAVPGTTRGSSEVLKIAAHSRPSAVAGAIAGIIREGGLVEIQSIGAGATNQAVKAIAIARAYLRDEAIGLVCIPTFIDLVIDGAERTGIRLVVERVELPATQPVAQAIGAPTP